MADAVGTGKLAALLALLGGLDVLVGDEVVEDDGDFILVENGIKAVLGEFVDGHGSGDVVAQDDVQLSLDQLALALMISVSVPAPQYMVPSGASRPI